jgi:hypothetical protein
MIFAVPVAVIVPFHTLEAFDQGVGQIIYAEDRIDHTDSNKFYFGFHIRRYNRIINFLFGLMLYPRLKVMSGFNK